MATTVRSRNSWFFIITKFDGKFEFNLGYKYSNGTVSFLSSAKRNAVIKPPWGPPVHCQFRVIKNDKGQLGEYFTFALKSGEKQNLKASIMNNLFAGENQYSRKCTSLVAQKKNELLAMYMTLLSNSGGFSHHREDIHHPSGMRKDSNGVQEQSLIDQNGSLQEFLDFKGLAESSAMLVSKSKDEAISQVIKSNHTNSAKKR